MCRHDGAGACHRAAPDAPGTPAAVAAEDDGMDVLIWFALGFALGLMFGLWDDE